ncbi:hypothetical protein V6N13_040498 [Hibiscus sabdariffa]
MWGKDIAAEVRMAGSNIFVFTFANTSSRDWVLEHGPWHIQNKPLILRNWEPNLQKLDFDLASMPLWVLLYNVPLELYFQKGLSYIASALGRPLCMDSITTSKKRLEFAKVCIEVHAGVVLPKSIDIKLPDGSFVVVRVVIPWYPPSCSGCLVVTVAPSVANVNVVFSICSSVAPPVLEEGTVVPMLNVENVKPAVDVPNGDVFSPAALNEEDVALVDTGTVEDDASVYDTEFPPLQSTSKESGCQPRTTFLGVMALLKEMKIMKKVALGKVSKSVECGGSDLPSVSSQ